jgi:hypothetical protein
MFVAVTAWPPMLAAGGCMASLAVNVSATTSPVLARLALALLDAM